MNCKIRINNSDTTKNLFSRLLYYLGYLYRESKTSNNFLVMNFGLRNYNLIVPYCESTIIYNNNEIIINYIKNKHDEYIELNCTLEIYNEISQNALAFYNKNDQRIYYINANTEWKNIIKNILVKKFDSLYLNENVIGEIKLNINKFISETKDYINFEIPYIKTFLISGLYQVDKNNLIFALATHYKANVYSIDPSRMKNDDSIKPINKLHTLLTNLSDETLNFVCIDNIDELIKDNNNGKDKFSYLTFSSLVATLVGLYQNEGTIIFLTMKNMENLNPSLIGPGRIDRHFIFDKNDLDSLKKIFYTHRPNDTNEQFIMFYDVIKKYDIPIALLQKLMFEIRGTDNYNIVDLIENIKKAIDFNKKILNDTKHLYS